ncbi:hypothetical protein FRC06_002856 [Ceratobasidium sp. 370]|nr:hypothetical protein FRC06_002856 [Ceratobasidium sp. 370]
MAPSRKLRVEIPTAKNAASSKKCLSDQGVVSRSGDDVVTRRHSRAEGSRAAGTTPTARNTTAPPKPRPRMKSTGGIQQLAKESRIEATPVRDSAATKSSEPTARKSSVAKRKAPEPPDASKQPTEKRRRAVDMAETRDIDMTEPSDENTDDNRSENQENRHGEEEEDEDEEDEVEEGDDEGRVAEQGEDEEGEGEEDEVEEGDDEGRVAEQGEDEEGEDEEDEGDEEVDEEDDGKEDEADGEEDEQGNKGDSGDGSENEMGDTELASARTGGAALAAGWADYVAQLRGKEAQASEEDVAVARELKDALIGAAYIRFVGPGDVHGVINLDNNPNARGNPRGLTETHVDLLHQILRRPNGKKDHESPIYIMVDEDCIDPALRSKMKKGDAFNPLSALPLLELVRKDKERETSLENELWVGRVDDRWLNLEDVNTRRCELKALREAADRPYCVLLNGHHRIRAMLRISKEIFDDWESLKKRVMEGEGDEEEFEEIARDVLQRVENNTWRCVIYNSKKLTEAGKTALVRNEHERPAKGMGNGEKAWWLAKKFDAEIRQEIDSGQGDIDRIGALNIIQARWRAEIGSKMLMTGQDDEAEAVKTKSDALKDVTGDEPASRLFFNPLSMEMVMDIKPALCVFDHNLDRSWAIEMLRPSGGPLIAHFWLAARVLISIFDVERGERLTEAEAWLNAEPKLVAGGYPAAAGFFDSFHVRTEKFPPYLEFYKESLASKFGDFYTKAIAPHTQTGRPFINESNPEAVLAVRNAFNNWGHWLQGQAKHASDWMRYVGASARIFAHLPLYRKGVKGPAFYPMAALPCHAAFKLCLERWAGGWSVIGNGDCLAVLEQLLDRGQIVWTVGAQGISNAVNWNEWYSRGRGLHQIVMKLVQCADIGPLEARLTEALSILEDPRLPISLHAINEFFPDGRTFRDKMRRFSAMKTGGFQYLGAQDLLEQYESEYGSFSDLHAKMLKARSALKIALWPDGGKRGRKATDPTSLEDVLASHKILGLVHQDVWAKLYPAWFKGWRDSEPKRMNTIGCGVGWGLLDRWFVDVKIPEILQDDRVRWTLHLVKRVFAYMGEEPWWAGMSSYKPRKALAMPKEIPEFLRFKNRAAMRKATMVGKAAKHLPDVPTPSSNTPKKKSTRASQKARSSSQKSTGASAKTPRSSQRAGKKSSKVKSSARIRDELDELDSEKDDNPESECNGGSESEHSNKTGSTRQSQGNRSTVQHERDGDVEGTAEPRDEPVAPEQGRTTTPASEEARDRDPIDFKPDQFDWAFQKRTGLPHDSQVIPPPKGFAYYHTTVKTPTYVMAPPIATVSMPHNAWRQLLEPRDAFDVEQDVGSAMNDSVLQALEYTGEQLADLLVHISVERGYLRETMVDVFNTLCASAQSSDVALMLLPDVLSGCRDLFIVRVAKLFLTHFDCTHGEAIHEASLMAAGDGMCDAEFAKMAEDGSVQLDLTTTFPKALQHKVGAQGKISVRRVGDTQEERDRTIQLMRYMLPSRGLGRTELESKERAFLGIEHRIARQWRTDASTSVVHGLNLNDEDPVEEPVGDYRESHQRPINVSLRNEQWASVKPAVVLQGTTVSPFSDGLFLPRTIKITKFLKSSDRPQGLTKLFTDRRAEYHKAWNDALEQEWNDWNGFMHAHERRLNSQSSQSQPRGQSRAQGDGALPHVLSGATASTPPSAPSSGTSPRHTVQQSASQDSVAHGASSGMGMGGKQKAIPARASGAERSQSLPAKRNNASPQMSSQSLGATQGLSRDTISPGDSVSQMAEKRYGKVLVPSSSQPVAENAEAGRPVGRKSGHAAILPADRARFVAAARDEPERLPDGAEQQGPGRGERVYQSLFTPVDRT